jgi:hypothetical protein
VRVGRRKNVKKKVGEIAYSEIRTGSGATMAEDQFLSEKRMS